MSRPGKQLSLRRLKRIGLIAATAAITVAALGIGTRMMDETSLAKTTKAEATPTVAIVMPKRGTKDQALTLPGDIQAYYEASIYARVSGYLKEWKEDIGAHVKAGQLLAEIDTPDVDQQLNQAKADLVAAQSSASLADVTSKRWQVLVKKDAVSQQDADEKASDAQSKHAAVLAAEANVQRLVAMEDFKRIVAPFDGIVTARETDVGALINAGSGQGPELFKVADVHKMRIYVRVPQALSGDIAVGETAELNLPQHPNRPIQATVATSSHAINQASRTLLVELQADNPNGNLQPGTYAEVHFKLPDSPDTLRLPTSALLFREDGLRVATVGPGDRIALKPVTIGRDLGTEVEIASGLAPTDRVVNSPSDSIAQGDIVRPAQDEKVAEAGN
ncbi:MAG TPA: efflux RND transporter periplasmic adaptor subunit [Alphaproteobacteria bacterium]|jgi:RND family efflux transporter MFP subunit|nr:efflux RND transporter periplasmic adaptor subunit [Alphaproteobacteria bacterium]